MNSGASLRVKRSHVFWRISQKPVTGTRHRRFLNAVRNDGFAATVSHRAFVMVRPIFGSSAQDGTSLLRAEIAHGKAYGALAMGMGSRTLFQRAQEHPYFVSAVNSLAQGRLVPVPGGVLIQNGGALLGAVGVSGDTSDNDETCAVAGIEAAGLKANAG